MRKNKAYSSIIHAYKKQLLFFLVVFLSVPIMQAQKYRSNEITQEIFELIYQLRLDEASVILMHNQRLDPNNPAYNHAAQQIHFFKVFIGEEKRDFDLLLSHAKTNTSALSKLDSNDPYKLFVEADILIQTAVCRLKFGEYFKAFRDVRKAYLLLRDNEKMFPHFLPNKRNLHILKALVGTIPDNFKWGASILGLEGDLNTSMKELERIIAISSKSNSIFRQETIVMYSYLTLHLQSDAENAWKILNKSGINSTDSPLMMFVFCNIAFHAGNNDYVIQTLKEKKFSYTYYPFLYLEFLLGHAKLNRMDPDADIYLKKYLEQFKGSNYLKQTCQLLSWHYLLQNKLDLYETYKKKTLAVGVAYLDEDKKAEKDAKDPIRPNPLLLKPRLLMDGGYHHKAIEFIEKNAENQFKTEKERVEFSYRLGRCYQEIKNYPSAIFYFLKVIREGRHLPAYFACNSAYNLGLIYESQKDYTKAREYFNLCLSISPDEYKNSLHQKAKTGLERLPIK